MILVKKKLKFHLCLFFDIQGMKIKFDHYPVRKQPMILIKHNQRLYVCLVLDNRDLQIMLPRL